MEVKKGVRVEVWQDLEIFLIAGEMSLLLECIIVYTLFQAESLAYGLSKIYLYIYRFEKMIISARNIPFLPCLNLTYLILNTLLFFQHFPPFLC